MRHHPAVTVDTPAMTRSGWFTRRRQQRAHDAEAVAAALAGGEQFVAEVVLRTRLTPRRAYRALSLLESEGRVSSRRAVEPWPRRRVYRLGHPG